MHAGRSTGIVFCSRHRDIGVDELAAVDGGVNLGGAGGHGREGCSVREVGHRRLWDVRGEVAIGGTAMWRGRAGDGVRARGVVGRGVGRRPVVWGSNKISCK